MSFFSACKKKPRTDFTVEEKALYDSLKTIAFKDIREKTDRKCDAVKDSLFTAYVDSIMTLRLAEVQQLITE